MGSHFFWDFESKKITYPKVTKISMFRLMELEVVKFYPWDSHVKAVWQVRDLVFVVSRGLVVIQSVQTNIHWKNIQTSHVPSSKW